MQNPHNRDIYGEVKFRFTLEIQKHGQKRKIQKTNFLKDADNWCRNRVVNKLKLHVWNFFYLGFKIVPRVFQYVVSDKCKYRFIARFNNL